MLGTFDKNTAGHIHDDYNNLPDDFDAIMVTRASEGSTSALSFTKCGSFKDFVLRRLAKIMGIINLFVKTGEWFSIKKAREHCEFCYYDNDFIPYSAKSILSKCPKGFVPDYISVHWSAEFISSKVIYDLHKLTGATIVYVMVDQAPFTGGCHFAVNCDHYINGCTKCPAYRGNVSSAQWKRKCRYLSKLPIIIVGVPSDLRMAMLTPFFADSKQIQLIIKPKVDICSQESARKHFNILGNRFFLFLGADSLHDRRKGFKFILEAVRVANKRISNLTLLIAGKNLAEIEDDLDGIDYVFLGFLDRDNLIKAFIAADTYISASIADSGPVMINYSISVGTPVVSFNVGIAQDLVKHKETGYIAEMLDYNSLADGIEYIASLSHSDRMNMRNKCIVLMDEMSKKGHWSEQLLEIHRSNNLKC